MQNEISLSDRYKNYLKNKKMKSEKINIRDIDKIAKILCPTEDEISEELGFLKKGK